MEAALAYFEIHVYSSRSSEHGGPEAMRDYIIRHAGEHSTLANRLVYAVSKPHAFISIDDRALNFNGNWLDPQYDPAGLIKFKPWYKDQP
jgi:hypothetical protein